MCEYSHSAQLDVSRAFVFREKLSPAPECLPRYDVTTSEDPDHRIADMTQVIGQPDQPNPKVGVSKIEWSADARYLASKSDSFPNTIWIWDTAKLRLSAVLVHVEPVRSFVWHPRETLLAICTASPNIYMWTPDGASCAKSPSETAIVGLQWNPVGSSLLVTERTAASMCWLSLQSGQDDGTASEGAR
jgi:WD40 repeat protein